MTEDDTTQSTPHAAPVEAPSAASMEAPSVPSVSKHSEMIKGSKRKLCWSKRDAYFACIDAKGSLDDEACRSAKNEYYDTCPSSWIKHFNKIRTQDKYKQGIARLREQGKEVPLDVQAEEGKLSQKTNIVK